MATIRTNIEWKNSKCGNITKCGEITLSEDCISVSMAVTLDEMKLFSSAHPAYIDVHTDLAKNINYSDCTIDDIAIDLDTSMAHVPYFESHCSSEGNIISWTLSELAYMYPSENPCENWIISAPYIYLLAKLEALSLEMKSSADIIFEGCRYRINSLPNPSFSKLTVMDGTPDVEGLLAVLSLYTKCPITSVVRASIDSGKQAFNWKPSTLPMDKETLQNYELAYLNIGERNHLSDYLESCSWNCNSERGKSDLCRAIYTFASSKYLDMNLQFLTIYSILDRYVGNTKGKDPYNPMRMKLRTYGIDISKIGVENDWDIISLGLTLVHDDGKDVKVRNFVHLRNFMLHFMTTPEIDNYLDRGVLVGNMRFAAFIILLKELGFEDVTFKDDWKHLSILIDDK